MKTRIYLSIILSLVFQFALAQGRVVINEFMPWSGCNIKSEYIELLNFGPGPMNIGCYIVTNGQFAVTIPPNTIIKPGQYFVLSGQDTLVKNCGNRDSAIKVNLNWESCNCLDKPIPAASDGFMKDGGGANEKVVLLDPSLKVIDAVSRNATPSSSISITSSSQGGACASKTFNLDLMGINYESIGSASGIDNSFSRLVDGDCGWVKTPAISAGAPNKTGNTSSATYSFSTPSASECQGTMGSVSILVNAINTASLFPMTYILAFDMNGDNQFTDADQYRNGTDSFPSSIDIKNLLYGRYRLTVGSSSGCNLKTFDFFIFNCYGIVLQLKLDYFNYTGKVGNERFFESRFQETSDLKSVVLEENNNGNFESVGVVNSPFPSNGRISIKAPVNGNRFYRLRMTDKQGQVSYSAIVDTGIEMNTTSRISPNPVKDQLNLQFTSGKAGRGEYVIYHTNGKPVLRMPVELKSGLNIISSSVNHINSGLYYVVVNSATEKIFSSSFMKQ